VTARAIDVQFETVARDIADRCDGQRLQHAGKAKAALRRESRMQH
jgi:hypothetical protein